MIPRLKVGRGVTGAVRYALGEGRDYATGRPRSEPKGDSSRVLWTAGQNFGFDIDNAKDADLARRIMEFDAVNQTSRTKPVTNDCVHIALGWRQGEQPTREQMIAAAQAALASLGMEDAKALFVAHGDEPYAHLHIIASKLNPAGYAYDLKRSYLKLSRWAEGYEREFSGGIVCIRRQEANQLRDAIDRRDAAAVLDLMTQQRSTFRAADLERALEKQISGVLARAQFAEQVLSQKGVVRLADQAGGVVSRYTTRAALEAEAHVLNAAATLAHDGRHRVRPADLDAILTRAEFASMSDQQAAAQRHATGPEGLALIDGQAGTGKSYTITAIRQAYERSGYTAIGLAFKNDVAGELRDSGFGHAATIHSELFALKNGRTTWTDRTLLVVDEAAMVDSKLLAHLVTHAAEAGAKLVLVGDDRQLSSIDRGGMYGVLKDRYGAAVLSEVRRQHKPDDRRAAELMAEGNFDTALRMYDGKGAITWRQNQEEAREALVSAWAKDSAADPSKTRFVFAYTNADVDRLNADIRAVRRARGELDGVQHSFATRHGRADVAAQDRLQITATDKRLGLENGQAGTVERIDGSTITLRLDGRKERTVQIDAAQFHDFRHGYAGTIYKGQGRTLDQTYLYHSEHWRSASSYVALTRHRDKTELFVAHNTAEDVKQLARQMARVDERRAASRFHQVGQPITFTPANSNELPSIEFAPKQAASARPLEWTERESMAAQQASALKQARDNERAAKPRIRVKAESSERIAPAAVPPATEQRPVVQPVQDAPRQVPAATVPEKPRIRIRAVMAPVAPPEAAPLRPQAAENNQPPADAAQTPRHPLWTELPARTMPAEPPPSPIRVATERVPVIAPAPVSTPPSPLSAPQRPAAPPPPQKANARQQTTLRPVFGYAPWAALPAWTAKAEQAPQQALPAPAQPGPVTAAQPSPAVTPTPTPPIAEARAQPAREQTSTPKAEPTKETQGPPNRRRPDATPLSTIADPALLRVIMRDIGSRRPDEPENANKPDGANAVWQWRPRPR